MEIEFKTINLINKYTHTYLLASLASTGFRLVSQDFIKIKIQLSTYTNLP